MSSSQGISNGLQSQLRKLWSFHAAAIHLRSLASAALHHMSIVLLECTMWKWFLLGAKPFRHPRPHRELEILLSSGRLQEQVLLRFGTWPALMKTPMQGLNAATSQASQTFRHEDVQTFWRKWHAKDHPNSHLAYSLASLIGDLSKQNIAFRSMYGQKLLFPFGRKDICNHLNETVFGFWTRWHCYSFWTHSDHAGFWCLCQCSVPK